MQELKFISSRNEEIIFNLEPPFIFWKIDGLNFPPITTIQSQAPFQHGSTLHNILLENRIITLTGHVHGYTGDNKIKKMYEERKRVNKVCNPLLGKGYLYYKNDYLSWRIPAFCRSNAYLEKIREIQTLTISFECSSPFFEDIEQTGIYFAYVEGGLEFPVILPNEFGMLGYRVDIDNNSDTNVPLEMFMEGGALNPIITNRTTGEFIALSRHLDENLTLYVNTNPEELEVSIIDIDPVTNEKVKTNAYGYLTNDSNLFSLIPGRNELVFESDDENKEVRIRIYIRKLYI